MHTRNMYNPETAFRRLGFITDSGKFATMQDHSISILELFFPPFKCLVIKSRSSTGRRRYLRGELLGDMRKLKLVMGLMSRDFRLLPPMTRKMRFGL